jgi:hypothetical protein
MELAVRLVMKTAGATEVAETAAKAVLVVASPETGIAAETAQRGLQPRGA